MPANWRIGIDTALGCARLGHGAQAVNGTQQALHGIGHVIRRPCPELNNLVVLLFRRDQTTAILLLGLFDLGGRVFNDLALSLRAPGCR